MAELFDGVVSESKVWRGAGRVVYADSTATFPTKISDVMNTTTFALQSGWTDLGGTSEDGVKVTRTVKTQDGVKVDQLKTLILLGEVQSWGGSVEMTMLHTDLDTLKLIWEGGAKTTVVAGEDAVVFGSPTAITERRMCVIQQHSKTGKLRMVAVRRVKLADTDYQMNVKSADPSGSNFNLVMLPDTGIGVTNAENMLTVFEQS